MEQKKKDMDVLNKIISLTNNDEIIWDFKNYDRYSMDLPQKIRSRYKGCDVIILITELGNFIQCDNHVLKVNPNSLILILKKKIDQKKNEEREKMYSVFE